ncbi:conjugal transfer protein TraF [Vibrio lamellibrachiae]|uniref:conjugal transfer protein TraF n=1 Tax=Vibrio lamellibrachiae TaxID=2910253 RepID=UPI003D09E0AE
MKQLIKLSVVFGLSIVTTHALAATSVADARSNGMGNTGVSTADYLLAPFHNPALVAVHRDGDRFGVLFPGLGANVRDTDNTIDTIDDLQDTINNYDENNIDPAIEAELNAYLDTLESNKPVVASGGAGAAVAIPLNLLSMNIFMRGYAEVLALPDITSVADSTDTADRYETSEVDMVAFGYSEIGVALAKRFSFQGQDIALGITPKFQDMTTYKQILSVEDFDISDYDQSETSKTSFNIDLGAVWLYQQFRAAIAVKDLFSQTIDTVVINNEATQYKLDTQVTVSGAYTMDYFIATMDWDLTEQSRFSGYDDDTQFLRFGVEGNAFGWAQLRAGYQMDLEDTLDDSVTAGIGISPGDLVSLDFAGNYAGDNQYGLSANLAFTF